MKPEIEQKKLILTWCGTPGTAQILVGLNYFSVLLIVKSLSSTDLLQLWSGWENLIEVGKQLLPFGLVLGTGVCKG